MLGYVKGDPLSIHLSILVIHDDGGPDKIKKHNDILFTQWCCDVTIGAITLCIDKRTYCRLRQDSAVQTFPLQGWLWVGNSSASNSEVFCRDIDQDVNCFQTQPPRLVTNWSTEKRTPFINPYPY